MEHRDMLVIEINDFIAQIKHPTGRLMRLKEGQMESLVDNLHPWIEEKLKEAYNRGWEDAK